MIKIDGFPLTHGEYIQPIYHVYKGLNALNESILRMESKESDKYKAERYNTYSIFLNFQFVLSSVLEVLERLEKKVTNPEDSSFLKSNIKTFYLIYLNDFADRLLATLDPNKNEIETLINIKKDIDTKLTVPA